MKLTLSNRKLEAKMSRTRDFAGKFSFCFVDKMTPTEIFKKGHDIITLVSLSVLR